MRLNFTRMPAENVTYAAFGGPLGLLDGGGPGARQASPIAKTKGKRWQSPLIGELAEIEHNDRSPPDHPLVGQSRSRCRRSRCGFRARPGG